MDYIFQVFWQCCCSKLSKTNIGSLFSVSTLCFYKNGFSFYSLSHIPMLSVPDRASLLCSSMQHSGRTASHVPKPADWMSTRSRMSSVARVLCYTKFVSQSVAHRFGLKSKHFCDLRTKLTATYYISFIYYFCLVSML